MHSFCRVSLVTYCVYLARGALWYYRVETSLSIQKKLTVAYKVMGLLIPLESLRRCLSAALNGFYLILAGNDEFVMIWVFEHKLAILWWIYPK